MVHAEQANAITLTNDDNDHWNHMVSQGHSELIHGGYLCL